MHTHMGKMVHIFLMLLQVPLPCNLDRIMKAKTTMVEAPIKVIVVYFWAPLSRVIASLRLCKIVE